MSAKEMFKELGFVNVKETRTFIEYTTNKSCGYDRVKFDFTLKRFVCDGRTGSNNLAIRQIDMKLLKAIQQQILELGWE